MFYNADETLRVQIPLRVFHMVVGGGREPLKILEIRLSVWSHTVSCHVLSVNARFFPRSLSRSDGPDGMPAKVHKDFVSLACNVFSIV